MPHSLFHDRLPCVFAKNDQSRIFHDVRHVRHCERQNNKTRHKLIPFRRPWLIFFFVQNTASCSFFKYEFACRRELLKKTEIARRNFNSYSNSHAFRSTNFERPVTSIPLFVRKKTIFAWQRARTENRASRQLALPAD